MIEQSKTFAFDIVVTCHKKDFYLARICIASIRFYYPEVTIYLVKDLLSGDFRTRELESCFSVKILDLGVEKMGWGMSKLLLAYSKRWPGRKFFVLDSDTILMGRVLENIQERAIGADYVVSDELVNDPDSNYFKTTYFDFKWLSEHDGEYEFPGFAFNSGTMLITIGILQEERVKWLVQFDKYPFWTPIGKKNMVCADQSVLNYAVVCQTAKSELKLERFQFQLWSESPELKKISLEDIKAGTMPLIAHWAGPKWGRYIPAMTRADILIYFEKYYFKQIPMGYIRRWFWNSYSFLQFWARKVKRKFWR